MTDRVNRPDLTIIPEFIDSGALFEYLLHDVDWETSMKARATASFGVAYNYSQMTYPQRAMPEALATLCERVEVAIGYLPNNCLLNLYHDGKSRMGYHSDDAMNLVPGTGVAILSLGAMRHIHYREKAAPENVHSFSLEPGTLLHMSDELQQQWEHAILKEANVGTRISVTLRRIDVESGH